jgi:phage tail sheath protein FI
MPVTPTYPGVYIEEIPSGVHTITGVATSITAFVGYTARGLDNRATPLFSFSDFERAFGGLASDSELSYAVQQFFGNGGSTGYVVRVPKSDGASASITPKDAANKKAITFTALSRGAWANNVIIDVDYANVPSSDSNAFNLTLTDLGTGTVESFANVTLDSTKNNFAGTVVNDLDSGSKIASVAVPDATASRPVQTGTIGGDVDLTKLKNDQNYTFGISADIPAGKLSNVVVTLVAQHDPLPGSVLGLCRLVERKANIALQQALPGAGIACTPLKTATGTAIRLQASFSQVLLPGTLDAEITLAAGTPNDALAMLNLASPGANVAHYWLGQGRNILSQSDPVSGSDGTKLPATQDLIGDQSKSTGIFALDKVDLFNLLCIPDATRAQPGNPNALDSTVSPNDIFAAAITYCSSRRAFLLIDPPPDVRDLESAADWKSQKLTVHDKNGAAYFPRLRLSDPLNNFQPRTFAPCAAVAGLYSRTDSARGVWKAPAGITDGAVAAIQGMAYKLTDAENGVLNVLGLNCFRLFPIYGSVCWGARTLVGADADASEWKYVPVRRLALFLEESLFRGTQWVVFEPNDEPLWAQIRLNVGAFMQTLFLQGAFQGKSPQQAYFVKCDSESTTSTDQNNGIVNILVGFAPLKPAEFVIIKIQQMAGQTAA